jgi:TolA-binding protein
VQSPTEIVVVPDRREATPPATRRHPEVLEHRVAIPPATRQRPDAKSEPASRPPHDGQTEDIPASRPATTVPESQWAEQELRIARTKIELRLYDQALVTLRDLVAKNPVSPVAPDASFLIASIQETQGKIEDAMATYLEIADRYRDNPRAPEALFRMAQDALGSRRPDRESEARGMLGVAVDKYPTSPWAAQALIAKGDLEERQKMAERDSELGVSVPSALITYRRIVAEYRASPVRETALRKLGEKYRDVKRYDLAAQTFTELAEGYPASADDAWFDAAEIYDKRLKDPASARAAYARVQATSPHFKDAQKRLQP